MSESLTLTAPASAVVGQEITISGTGAQPGELVTISESAIRTLHADPFIHLGGTYCIQSSDVNTLEVEPVDYVFIGWQHDVTLEEDYSTGDFPYLAHAANPYESIYNATNGRVVQSKGYHGDDHVECWGLVLGGKSQLVGDVQVRLTAKRAVKADSQGNFTTAMLIPVSKLVAGQHEISVQAGNRTETIFMAIDGSSITNEQPIAYIYAPKLSDASWKVRAGEAISLDGGYSADNDGAVAAYHWDLGDGTKVDGRTVEHVYQAPGQMKVVLTVEDDQGASDEMSAVVSVI